MIRRRFALMIADKSKSRLAANEREKRESGTNARTLDKNDDLN
jgi:hypothetical protein